jgi:L-asparaginase/Glu-tRNA(Gln) amidotransferase subunit D
MLHIIVGVMLALLGAVGLIVGFIGAASDPAGASHWGYLLPGTATVLLGIALAVWG